MSADAESLHAQEPNAAPTFPKHHPAGLWVLFTTEMWERFCFYAMRAILVLYLVDVSTNESTPGFGWSEADAYRLYGIYTCLVYFLPLLGGWIADQYLGQRRCVFLGGMLMALGEFCLAATEFVRIGGGTKVTLATDPTALAVFYAGLALMIIGNGFFKPCISVMVGQLYAAGDRMRDSAFSIFYMGINVGAFFSPLIAGTVAEKYGYHHGFIIAGIGMILGLISFSFFGRAYLKGIGDAPHKHDPNAELTPQEKAAREKALYEQTRPLVKEDWDRLYVILVLSLFVIAFWVSFEQAGSSLNVFAKAQTDRTIVPSVAAITPKFIAKNLYLNNEDLIEFKAAVDRVKALADQASHEGEESKVQSFGERFKHLFTFELIRDERPLDVLYSDLKTEAKKLRDELSKSKYPNVQTSIEALDKEIATVHSKIESLQEELKAAEAENRHVAAVKKSLKEQNQRSSVIVGAVSSLLANEQGSTGTDIQESLGKMKKTEKGLEGKFDGKTAYTFPTTWYQSVNALGIVVFAPIFTVIWFFLAARGIEPSTPMKFAIGLLILSLGFFLMIPGAIEAKTSGGKAGPHWLIWCYLFSTWGELCLSPVGLSMVTKLSPARYASSMMGVWFIASSVAYLLAGELARMFGSGEGVDLFFGPEKGLADFFLLMGAIPFVIGVIALCLAPKLKRMMHGASV